MTEAPFQHNVFQPGVFWVDTGGAPPRPFDPTLMHPRTNLRVWDDYGFRKKGIKYTGGPMPVRVTPLVAVSVHENVRLVLPLMSSADRVSPLITEWSIVGGADAARFEMVRGVPWTLRWQGDGVRDFEAPVDANLDNTYEVQVRAVDTTSGQSAKQTISVTVLDVSDFVPDTTPPTITSAAAVSNVENTLLAHILTANEAVTWTKVGGVDAAHFTLTGAVLSWTSGTKDFESPHGPAYVVVVRATDTAGNYTDQTVTVTVTNVEDSPPNNVVVPAVTGDPTEGETLTCTSLPGHWTGSPTIVLTYQWCRTAAPIPPGTTLTDDDGEVLTDDSGAVLTT